jgi:hypothetical protein
MKLVTLRVDSLAVCPNEVSKPENRLSAFKDKEAKLNGLN